MNLSQLLHFCGTNRQRAGTAAGLSPTTLRNWELGLTMARRSRMELLAVELGVSVEKLASCIASSRRAAKRAASRRSSGSR